MLPFPRYISVAPERFCIPPSARAPRWQPHQQLQKGIHSPTRPRVARPFLIPIPMRCRKKHAYIGRLQHREIFALRSDLQTKEIMVKSNGLFQVGHFQKDVIDFRRRRFLSRCSERQQNGNTNCDSHPALRMLFHRQITTGKSAAGRASLPRRACKSCRPRARSLLPSRLAAQIPVQFLASERTAGLHSS